MEAVKVPVFVFCLLYSLDLGSTVPTRRVVGGQVLEYGSWPFLVSMHFLRPNIFYNSTKIEHLCGGSLIYPEWVVTAGHCISDLVLDGMGNMSNWKVVLGEYNQYLKDEGEQVFQIAQIYPHPNFTVNPLLNDIALLRLSQPANMTRYVDLVDIYTGRDLPNRKQCQVAGWGQVAAEPLGYAMHVPLETTVFLINREDCKQRYKTMEEIEVDGTVICAGNPKIGKTDACQGDSGGPMVCLSEDDNVRYLVGVVSTGEGCGLAKYPGIYTSISDFAAWINNTIATERASSVGESGTRNTMTESGLERNEAETTTSIRLEDILD